MKSLILALLLAGLASALQGQALPGSVWYGGETNFNNGASSERNTSVSDSIILDDFTLFEPTVVSGLYGEFITKDVDTPEAFDYEIRSGVSKGNGGTLVAYGYGVEGDWIRSGHDRFGYTGWLATIQDLNVELDAGTYWMGIRVVGNGTGRAWIWETNGQDGIGKPLGNGNSFVNSMFWRLYFEPLEDMFGRQADYSYGVQAVPEPASVLALACALGALAARRRRK